MRAIAVDHLGAEPALIELPEPEPGPGEVLLTVRAAGVNPLDLKAAGGALDEMDVAYRTPLVLGFDVVGRVEALGDGVEAMAIGDTMFGLVWGDPLGHGTYAERTVIPASAPVAPVPAALSFEVAAMLPMPGGTALRIVENLSLDTDQTVVVIGAAGAVGTYLVQLAARAGARVIGVASAQDRTRLVEHGLRVFVDRHADDVVAEIQAAAPDGADAVVDVASDAGGVSALASVLRPGGTYISLVGSADVDALAERDLRAENFFYQARSADAKTLADLAVEGELEFPPRNVLSLDEAPEALAAWQRGERKGKFVIVP